MARRCSCCMGWPKPCQPGWYIIFVRIHLCKLPYMILSDSAWSPLHHWHPTQTSLATSKCRRIGSPRSAILSPHCRGVGFGQSVPRADTTANAMHDATRNAQSRSALCEKTYSQSMQIPFCALLLRNSGATHEQYVFLPQKLLCKPCEEMACCSTWTSTDAVWGAKVFFESGEDIECGHLSMKGPRIIDNSCGSKLDNSCGADQVIMGSSQTGASRGNRGPECQKEFSPPNDHCVSD